MPQYGNRANRMTIYDLMEARGVFASNPANAGSMSETGESLYVGPLEYPKMLYHPTGGRRILIPERTEPTPVGPIVVPAQTELIWQIVSGVEEEDALREEGWHDHPADAIAASPDGKSGKVPIPVKSASYLLSAKDQEIARLKEQLAQARVPSKSRASAD